MNEAQELQQALEVLERMRNSVEETIERLRVKLVEIEREGLAEDSGYYEATRILRVSNQGFARGLTIAIEELRARIQGYGK